MNSADASSRLRIRAMSLIIIGAMTSDLFASPNIDADETKTPIVIRSPRSYQVFQRQGMVPALNHEHHPGGAVRGYAVVTVRIDSPDITDGLLEYRIQTTDIPPTEITDWTPLAVTVQPAAVDEIPSHPTDSKTSDAVPKDPVSPDSTSDSMPPGSDATPSTTAETQTPARDQHIGQITVKAGGWYQLELRYRRDDEILAEGQLSPFGVGEVFLVAGQSYATNCNDEVFRVQDPKKRVAAWNHHNGQWQVADDPQPAGDGSDGGSIWPVFGDLMTSVTDVPTGLVNVAVGATSTEQWKPEGPLHQRLVKAGLEVGDFRAVLWQQGESDVIEKTSTSDYVRKMIEIRTAADQIWKNNRPWLPAKSTLHPTVYHEAYGEAQIRTAIDQLWSTPGFQRGPDTDTLAGHNRGLPGSRRHFTGAGQRNAAALWFAEVMNLLNETRPGYEAVLPHLNQMHLLSPAWNSDIVHRESSILLQESTDGPIKARLAFPAAEVISAVSAAGDRRFDSGADFQLSEDGLTLTFRREALNGGDAAGSTAPLPFVRSEDLYPPAGSPNSYAHRVGHPDQHLLYNAGRWFHDRNVEITYRRADRVTRTTESVSAAETVSRALPGTKAILKSGRSLTIAVSGDSISTGLDASLTASAPPGQPGYPDLVAAQLKQQFGSEIRLVNRAVAGWSVSHGVQDSESLMASKPDIVIVAYGMNDVGRRDPDWFENQTRLLIKKIRDAAPNAEIILVAPMRGNREWIHTPTEMFGPYRDRLRALTGPGIVLADVTSVWEQLLIHKHDLDLTGNGLNHPNDFGHRLYAQTVLQCLIAP